MERNKLALILIRILMGGLFIYHGLFKIFVFTFGGTAQFFESIGYAGSLAYIVIFVEIIGGILLIFGIETRWVSLVLAVEMLFALPAHWANGFSFTNGGIEVPFIFFIVLIALAINDSRGFDVSQEQSIAS
ncbi:DoxX family protein [Microaerobacter geothermalis]|uniref:DoxX family protein n=1 Tax=Microaerobacter geothermalis TaxID=674972 RepID=UPI001F19FDE5|nr:DoxX family protein [Microaerobacter geothermalis]MCF6094252.1 DoxX family protein [Microaerobacter geothermalis]